MTARDLLHAYWLKFDGGDRMNFPGLGVGVTAFSLDDALSLLRAEVRTELPMIADVREDVTFAELDQGHVVPNMHPLTERGVWFPKYRPFS